jgi:hypothetical protein
MDRIRHEFQNEPRFNSGKKKGGASLPRCCKIGCYEVRIPPAAFCDAHSNEAQDD